MVTLTQDAPSEWVAGDLPGPAEGQRADGVEDVFRREFTQLVRFALLLTDCRETAEDLVQDCFAKVAAREGEIDNVGAYLRTSVANACYSWQRRQKLVRERPVSSDEATPPPSHLVEFNDALLTLSERQRTAIVGRYFAGLSDDDLAQALHCRRATVRSLVARGLNQLREELKDGI
jgi:RNA polymerase sigma factor (sigma-70 family)